MFSDAWDVGIITTWIRITGNISRFFSKAQSHTGIRATERSIWQEVSIQQSFLAEFCRLGIHEKKVLLLNFTYTLSPYLNSLHKFKEKQFFQHIHRSNIWEFDRKCCKLWKIVKCVINNHTGVSGSKFNSCLPRTSLLYIYIPCIFLLNWPATLFSLKFSILYKECHLYQHNLTHVNFFCSTHKTKIPLQWIKCKVIFYQKLCLVISFHFQTQQKCKVKCI